MKKAKLFTIIAMVSGVLGLFGFIAADDDVLQKAATQLSKWLVERPQEKVYLHLDKPYYAIGDDIWIKAYITVGSKHQLSAVSNVLNIELIDDRDSIAKSIKLPATSGVAWGDFKLNDSLREGNYRLRAYTNWMRNADEGYFFDRTIHVGNSISNDVFTKASYSYSTGQKNQKVVEATIHYTNLAGEPYDGKEVTYQVELMNRQVAKGKGITDSEGNLTLSFNNAAPALLKSGHITTVVKMSPVLKITKVIPVTATSAQVDVQFFPEGGTLLSDTRNKVAFKAVGADGLGVDIKGTVVDNDGVVNAAINTQHLGMGSFGFTPVKGKTYTAKITYPDGSEGELPLPKAVDEGYVLNVYNTDAADVTVKISTNQATFNANQGKEINLMVQSAGAIIFTAKTQLTSPVFSTKIARIRFPSGISQFTLFSATGDAMNERIALMQNNDLLNIALSTPKTTFAPREKVKIDIKAANPAGQPTVGIFSIAVTNESTVPVDEADESTILSNLLLTSDIKGYVEKPNYYFANVSDRTRADLDVLMLTQGYRRFTWKQIMADIYTPLAFKAEKGIDISGHVKTEGGKPVVKGKVTVFSTGNGVFLLDTVTDEQGAFTFKNLVFRDSAKFIVQARKEKGSKFVEIEMDNNALQAISVNKNNGDIAINVNNSLLAYLQNSKAQYDDFLKYGLVTKTIMLKSVDISEKRKSPVPNSENLNGPGNADQVLKGDALENCASIVDCLRGRANFISFRNGKAYSNRNPGKPMLVVLDGMQMLDFDLDDLNTNDISSVEVLRSLMYSSVYGSSGANGVLVITTKRGDDGQPLREPAPGIMIYRPKGYYQARQFYAPQYDDPKTNTRVADLRTTVYWSPNVITNKDGASSVSFFNADGKGTYKVVIEGVDSDGNLGRQVFRYKVQ